MMTVSNGVMLNIAFSIYIDINSGVAEYALTSRTPMLAVFVGKTTGQMIIYSVRGILVLGTIVLVAPSMVEATDIGLLLVSCLMAMVGVFHTSLLFPQLMLLARGKGGLYNTIMPFIAVLSGFTFPVEWLPPALRIAARFVPTSWAMETVWWSIQGTESLLRLIGSLGDVSACVGFMVCHYFDNFQFCRKENKDHRYSWGILAIICVDIQFTTS